MSKQMSLEDFKENLKNASKDLVLFYKLPINKAIMYEIELDLEKEKKHTSMDEFIYRAGLADLVSEKEYFSDEEVSKIFCRPNNLKYPELFPLWIKVSYLYQNDAIIIFKLHSSTRFRKHSLLKNQESGYAPFEAVRRIV